MQSSQKPSTEVMFLMQFRDLSQFLLNFRLPTALLVLPILSLSSPTLSTLLAQEGATEAPQSKTEKVDGQKETEKDSKEEPNAEGPKKVLRPFMWKIEGKEKPSYLFGTIHVTDKRVLDMHPASRKAFRNADTLFVEMIPEDAMKQAKVMVYQDKKFVDMVDKETLDRVKAQLSKINEVYGDNVELLNFKIWAWPLLLPNLEAQLKNPNREILDMTLVTKARDADKFCGSLEVAETQLDGFEELTQKEQIAFLKDSLASMEKESESKDVEKELVDLYCLGDVKKLSDYFDAESEEGELSDEMTEKVMSAILYRRNKRMAAKIKSVMDANPDKSHFFAAGTAHFVGKKSVQDYLKELGIKAIPYDQENAEGEK